MKEKICISLPWVSADFFSCRSGLEREATKSFHRRMSHVKDESGCKVLMFACNVLAYVFESLSYQIGRVYINILGRTLSPEVAMKNCGSIKKVAGV